MLNVNSYRNLLFCHKQGARSEVEHGHKPSSLRDASAIGGGLAHYATLPDSE